MDRLSDVFDVVATPIPPPPVNHPLTPVTIVPKIVTDDAEFARANIRSLIETARLALENVLNVAIQSESPRAYQVLSELINTTSDLNTKLIDVHQREQRMIAPKSEEAKVVNQSVTNNVVFSGTTSELNEIIMKRMQK